MLDTDLELNLEEELSEIPPEYQDVFRQTIENELAETEQNRTDTDILTYLRQRRDDFKRGGFIRPDGRPGMVTLNPETMYEQALPELAQSSLDAEEDTVERRRTFIKIGALVVVVVLFVIFVFRGRSQRAEEQEMAEAGTPAAEAVAAGTPTPTPPLPEITGADDSLQTIGNLGGALTIGRPSAIELNYGRTEETIALAIDPSKPTPKGELRFNQATMLSDNPVAVWLFGTVLNYAIGIPDSMVRNLELGDRITLNTDTGTSLQFIVAETKQAANYDAGRLLSQNRLGLTLFSLPGVVEDDVSAVFANYDIAGEEGQVQEVLPFGEPFTLDNVGTLEVAEVAFEHTGNGDIRIAVGGAVQDVETGTVMMLSLNAGREQTTAVQLTPNDAGEWQMIYTLPKHVTGLQLLAEFRKLPAGTLSVVQLGEVPRLFDALQTKIAGTWWDDATGQVEMTVSVHNPADGDIFLGSDFIQILNEGGDALESNWQVTPHLPLKIEPGNTLGLQVTFPLYASSARVQIGADLWEVSADRRGTSPEQPLSDGD